MSNVDQTRKYVTELEEERDIINAKLNLIEKGNTIAPFYGDDWADDFDVYCVDCKMLKFSTKTLVQIPFEPYICYDCAQPDEEKQKIAERKKYQSTVEIVQKARNAIVHDGIDPQELVKKILEIHN